MMELTFRVSSQTNASGVKEAVMNVLSRVPLYAALALIVTAAQATAADIWNIKCFDADGQTIAVKAISAGSDAYDVKAIGTEDPDRHDVKALHPDSGEQLPVKVVTSQDEGIAYSDVKGIEDGDQLIAIKALTGSGEILDVKAFLNPSTGRYDIKCVTSDGERLGLKAISPAGQVYDVKGIKELPEEVELGVEIEAHIKAVPQEG